MSEERASLHGRSSDLAITSAIRSGARRNGKYEMAGELGFEPRLTESESAVLPLNYPPITLKSQRLGPFPKGSWPLYSRSQRACQHPRRKPAFSSRTGGRSVAAFHGSANGGRPGSCTASKRPHSATPFDRNLIEAALPGCGKQSIEVADPSTTRTEKSLIIRDF